LQFEILSEIRDVETIASGRRLRARRRLVRRYGKGTWRKLKGHATVLLHDGTILEVEVHWYEAHGIGRKEIKVKKPLGITW
jgi:hypothetical protein